MDGEPITESEVAELRAELDAFTSYVRSVLDLTNRKHIRWLMDVAPQVAERIFPHYVGRRGKFVLPSRRTHKLLSVTRRK